MQAGGPAATSTGWAGERGGPVVGRGLALTSGGLGGGFWVRCVALGRAGPGVAGARLPGVRARAQGAGGGEPGGEYR